MHEQGDKMLNFFFVTLTLAYFFVIKDINDDHDLNILINKPISTTPQLVLKSGENPGIFRVLDPKNVH